MIFLIPKSVKLTSMILLVFYLVNLILINLNDVNPDDTVEQSQTVHDTRSNIMYEPIGIIQIF